MFNKTNSSRLLLSFVLLLALLGTSATGQDVKDRRFQEKLLSLLPGSRTDLKEACEELLEAYPIQSDWLCQDTGKELADFLSSRNPEAILRSILLDTLKVKGAQTVTSFGPLLDLYITACESRRETRLEGLRSIYPKIVFLKNFELGNAPRGPLALSDGPYKGTPFSPGASICTLDLTGAAGKVSTLLSDPSGMIRDLDVSYDGERILFSWKKSTVGDDFHLYEMTVSDGSVRQITSDKGVADIQARYLPDGIVYHSSRCGSVVDCNETIAVVNFYRSDLDGKNIRRLTFDQVSTQYPSVLQDGRIIYTRWEYNDRGQIYPQGLFAMNPDGTKQKAVYGNNSWFPTSLIQARDIPGSQKLIAVLAGHHTPPCGKLGLIDLSKGHDEGKGITLLAPVRDIEYKRVDKACQDDVLFQYPFPLSEDDYIVGYSLYGRKKSQHFGIYYMRSDGGRELLAWDDTLACRQALPLAPRKKPESIPSTVVPDSNTGVFYVDDVYRGEGLRGIERGTVKRLRVIALDYRAGAVGISFNHGVAGNARVDTPVSIGGAWDTKRVLGDAEVYADGSACFIVPAQTPVYFQAIDEKGRAVQSMRSWSTLQPGESFSCVGCHENKNTAPVSTSEITVAMRKGPKALKPFYGPARGFSYLKEVQPILDRNCVECHQGRQYSPSVLKRADGDPEDIFCVWPAPYTRTKTKKAIYHLPSKQPVGSVSVAWLSGQDKKWSRPTEWTLSYKNGAAWKEIRTIKGEELSVSFPAVTTDAMMIEATLPKKASGGIAKWEVYDAHGRGVDGEGKSEAFSLLGREVYEDLSGRAWAESYLALLGAGFRKQGKVEYHLAAYPNDLVNWISPQSGPTVLEPYSFGSKQSGLIAMLESGHEGVSLSRKDMEILSCWIDLAVPYCGEYPEANIWTPEEMRFYNRQLERRTQLSSMEKHD